MSAGNHRRFSQYCQAGWAPLGQVDVKLLKDTSSNPRKLKSIHCWLNPWDHLWIRNAHQEGIIEEKMQTSFNNVPRRIRLGLSALNNAVIEDAERLQRELPSSKSKSSTPKTVSQSWLQFTAPSLAGRRVYLPNGCRYQVNWGAGFLTDSLVKFTEWRKKRRRFKNLSNWASCFMHNLIVIRSTVASWVSLHRKNYPPGQVEWIVY